MPFVHVGDFAQTIAHLCLTVGSAFQWPSNKLGFLKGYTVAFERIAPGAFSTVRDSAPLLRFLSFCTASGSRSTETVWREKLGEYYHPAHRAYSTDLERTAADIWSPRSGCVRGHDFLCCPRLPDDTDDGPFDAAAYPGAPRRSQRRNRRATLAHCASRLPSGQPLIQKTRLAARLCSSPTVCALPPFILRALGVTSFSSSSRDELRCSFRWGGC
jgi:hypothetical protein